MPASSGPTPPIFEPSRGGNSHDVTLDLPGGVVPNTPRGWSDSAARSSEPDCAKVELVEGSGQRLSAQTTTLHLHRLRAATLALFGGSAVFLAKRIFFEQRSASFDASIQLADRITRTLHWSHVLVLGCVCVWLWLPRMRFTERALRGWEALVFGLTAVFFAAVQHLVVVYTAMMYQYIDEPLHIWCLLLFVYGCFIPNPPWRAALVLALLALTPLSVSTWLACNCQISGYYIEAFDITQDALFMSVAFGTALFGNYTINQLRREAYEARQLGQYRLRQRIGVGGMGEVYLAEHQMLKRPCAIKLIRPSQANDPRALARFEREVRATATLNHPNTVEIFDYGSAADGTFYYVMEYLPGMTLADLVARYGPLPPERVVYLLEQACGALAEAHAIGLVHRDVKPGNIFAAERGGVYDVVKLLDFGLVKPRTEENSLELTQIGAITGSPLYLAPEQALGEATPDGRADLYSLGAVAYFLLTGRPPFSGDTAMRVIMAHVNEPVVRPARHRPGIPADVEQIVLRCLEKKPEDRFTDAGALADALAGCSVAGLWNRRRAAEWWTQLAEAETVLA